MTYEEQAQQEILTKLLECSTCQDLGSFNFEKPRDDLGKIDFYLKVLPGVGYVVDQLVNYIFSNGLTTGLVDEDVILEKFLYRTNLQGATNYSVLRDAIGISSSYGEAGIRWYEDDIYLLKPGTYAPLTMRVDGIKRTAGFVTTKDGKNIGKGEIDFSDIDFGEGTDLANIFKRYFDERGQIFLDKSDFRNIRNTTAEEHGKSPLLEDELRLDLLVTTYERLIHDLNYEGPGRILFWTDGGYIQGENNDIGTTQVLNQSMVAKRERDRRADAAIEKFAEEFKKSKTDSIGVVPSIFSKDYARFPKDTKATEFFDWIEQEGVILSQDYGMSPSLLELGRLSGNVSMEKIIDDSMLNKIVPKRESYAIQFSDFLADKLGVSKVYFNKYELQQAEDENTMRTKITNIMAILNSIGTEQTDALVRDFGNMLDANIHHENGDLKQLKVALEKEKENENHVNDRTTE